MASACWASKRPGRPSGARCGTSSTWATTPGSTSFGPMGDVTAFAVGYDSMGDEMLTAL